MKTKVKPIKTEVKKNVNTSSIFPEQSEQIINHFEHAWLASIDKLKQNKYTNLESAKNALIQEIMDQLKFNTNKDDNLADFLKDLCDSDPEIDEIIMTELVSIS
jgi:hypothetical protein